MAEHHRVVVPGEPEVTSGAVFARMGMPSHEFGDVTQIAIEDDRAIQLHFQS